MDGKVHSDKVSEKNKEGVAGNQRKGVKRNLAELCYCSSVLWNVELASNETRYLAEAFSKESVEEGVAWLLLIAYSKIPEEMI